MSQRYSGGVVTANPTTPTLSAATGVWTMEQQFQNIANWPKSTQLISRSVRFRSSATAYFSRTPASASNRKTWTWSGWVKRGTLSAFSPMFYADAGGNTNVSIMFLNDNTLRVFQQVGGVDTFYLVSTSLYRDPSAWYHIVVAVDTTQATNTNRLKMYVNGVQTTNTSTLYPSQNFDGTVNNNVIHYTGALPGGPFYFDGYMTEINFIDGQALTPSYFGFTDGNGVWQPATYSGTYGTNGFYLNFSDNSAATATTIGKDYSGNGNNWTPNNISVTAGVTYDSMLDVPTNYADGGNGRGNYAVLNPLLSAGGTTANGNLQVTTATGVGHSRATIAIPTSGKWYCEFTAVSAATATDYIFGIVGIDTAEASYGYNQTPSYAYTAFGERVVNGTFTSSFYSSFTTGDIIGCAVNLDSNELTWYKNGTAQTAISITNGSYFWIVSDASGTRQITAAFNAGQRPFSYTPPTGFSALNTQNLPTPTISNGANYMAATTYTGTGSSLTIANTVNGISFQPDLVWVKGRSGATDHALYDAVRGVQKQLESNTTTAETTETTGLTAFGSTGFTVGALAQMNTNTATYVAWQWLSGAGSTSSNTSGSITSTVSVNATAGFSIVTYTGTGSAATIGHSLGVAPKMIIIFERSPAGDDHIVYHASLTSNQYSIRLNTTAAQAGPSAAYWNSTSPTSTVFSVGTSGESNQSTATYVAYCFAEVAGYSAFGSYTGNGSTDGPFVYLGFRPRWVMIRNPAIAANWLIFDSSRDTYNQEVLFLFANTADAEQNSSASVALDFVSNGFKIRQTSGNINASGNSLIYAAFAENPFKLSRAR